MTREALIVIDMQFDFLTGGALAVPEGRHALPAIERLVGEAETVVVTQDWHPKGHGSFASVQGLPPFSVIQAPYGDQVLWPDHCVAGTSGAQLALPLLERRADLILRKGSNPRVDSYSAFFENDRVTATGLAGWLRDRGIRRVRLAGLALDYCVAYTALDAAALGFETVVELSACRGISGDTVAEMTGRMTRAGAVLL